MGQVHGAVVVKDSVVGVHVCSSTVVDVGVSICVVARGGWVKYCRMVIVDGKTLFRKR